MSNNMKIYQLYYKEDQLDKLDPAFEPYDNTTNPRPELREWYIWDQAYRTCLDQGLTHWGFVSWKFKDKTGLTGKQFVDFIEQFPGYDVYFVNPCLINEAVFQNSWLQGDMYHPGISDIGNKFLEKIGHTDIDVKDFVLDRSCTMYANYIVGSAKFWESFMKFSYRLFEESELDAEFKDMVFGPGKSNYGPDPSLPMFTFLIERLVPIFIELGGFNALPFSYTPDTLLEKYVPYADDLTALSNLKVLINRYSSDELYYIWDHYRQKFLQNNPGILGLE